MAMGRPGVSSRPARAGPMLLAPRLRTGLSVQTSTHPRATLWPAATEGGSGGLAADGQVAAAGPAMAGLGRGGDAELLGDLEAATPRTARHIAGAADQGLEGVIAGVAVILVNRHIPRDSWPGMDLMVGPARGTVARGP